MNRNVWPLGEGVRNARKALSFLLFAGLAVAICPPAAGQEQDGRIALPGEIRVDLGADYLRGESRFGPDRATDPWGVNGPLGADRLMLVADLAGAYDTFLAETGGAGEGPAGAELSAGTLGLEGVASSRVVPMRLAVGVLPRLEIGIGGTAVRSQRFVTRFDISPGDLGLNPDATVNGAILGPLASTGEALGAGPLLPIAGSAAGELLQARVAAATGESLQLPTEAVTAEQLALLGFERPAYDPGRWRPGDLVVDGRFQLLRSFEGHMPPPDGATDWRLTAIGSYRFPLNIVRDTAGESKDPLIGYSGFSAGLVGDLFLGERFWMSAGGSVSRLEREEDEPPGTSEWTPGTGLTLHPPENELALWVTPRLRLTDQIAIGGTLSLARPGATAADPQESGTANSFGLSIRYSNLVGTRERDRGRPWDAAAGFMAPLSGSDGIVRTTRAFFRLSIVQRLWGSRPTPAAPAP